MSSVDYIHLDDQSIATGGTSLTGTAILEDRMDKILSLSCQDLTIEEVQRYQNKLWIIGNITNLYRLDPNIIHELLSNNFFVKIEFDYNFCPYRGEIPHQKLANQICKCPHDIILNPLISSTYDLIIKNAKHSFFMSERQRAIYSIHMPLMRFDKTSVLSSCFTKNTFDLLKTHALNYKNNQYAILEGYGGWHSQAKGVTEAKNFCVTNNIPYQILPNQSYDHHIETLSKFKGLVFMPIIDDTCPRCVIEAKLLNLDVLTNINSQHTTEGWWNKSLEQIEIYLKNRPKHFWKIVDENCHTNAS